MLQGAKVTLPRVSDDSCPSRSKHFQVTAGAIQSLGSAIVHSIPLPAPLHPEGTRCACNVLSLKQLSADARQNAAPATYLFPPRMSYPQLRVSVSAAAGAGQVLMISRPPAALRRAACACLPRPSSSCRWSQLFSMLNARLQRPLPKPQSSLCAAAERWALWAMRGVQQLQRPAIRR